MRQAYKALPVRHLNRVGNLWNLFRLIDLVRL